MVQLNMNFRTIARRLVFVMYWVILLIITKACILNCGPFMIIIWLRFGWQHPTIDDYAVKAIAHVSNIVSVVLAIQLAFGMGDTFFFLRHEW